MGRKFYVPATPSGGRTLSIPSAVMLLSGFAPVFSMSGAVSGAPRILYTDTLTVPTRGGENGLGGYVWIFGTGFGSAAALGSTTTVTIGGVAPANYRALVTAINGGRYAISAIGVQVGSLGGALAGVSLPVKVTVGGVDSNTDITIKAVPTGRVLFASLSGNNATAVVDDITKPFRYLQNAAQSTDVYRQLRAGDQLVLRSGSWSDTVGVDNTWLRWSGGSSWSVVNGTNDAWIHITGHPGPINGNAPEVVNYKAPNGAPGGFQGPWSAIEGTSGSYISYSNLHMSCSAATQDDGAPINFQTSCGPQRVVNMELGPWPVAGVTSAKAGGVSGHGIGNKILGCWIHDIGGTSDLENHAIYGDSRAMTWEVAYNFIQNITGGSGVQFNDNQPVSSIGVTIPGTSTVWQGFTDMNVHHNWIEVTAKYGVHYSDQNGYGGYYSGTIWDNVLIRTGLPPFRRNHGGTPTDDILFAYNSVYDCMTSVAGIEAYYSDEWQGNGNSHVRLYYNLFAFGPHTQAGTSFEAINASPAMDRVGNCYWNNGQSAVAPSADATKVVANPLFTAPTATIPDLSLQATSPCLNKGIATLPYGLLVNDDFFFATRPKGSARDIGAVESA